MKTNLVEAAIDFFEQKELTKEQTQEYLEEVFKKAFERDGKFNINDPIPEGIVESKVDLDTGEIIIKRTWVIQENFEESNKFIHLPMDDERIEGLNLKDGDTWIEDINLDDIPYWKAQHIKQLLIQKLREADKLKFYEQFKEHKNKIINAKVFKVANNYVILDYENVSIFMPRKEYLPTDNFKLGDNVLVYILEVEKESKDSQIIASRSSINFVRKLIERENVDVQDNVVEIMYISREPGHKTKLLVKSNVDGVDPVGTLIGIKGSKLEPIINELNGERIDVIEYNSDIKQLIKSALTPAKIHGIKYTEISEEQKEAIVVVEDKEFLPAIGRRGINVMLAAKLSKVKIDVKTLSEAEEEGLEYEVITHTPYQSRNRKSNNSQSVDFDLKEVTLDELAEMDDMNDNSEQDESLENYMQSINENQK